MARIERNGLSGLLLRGAVIAFAAAIFGSAPKVPPAQADALSTISVAAR